MEHERLSGHVGETFYTDAQVGARGKRKKEGEKEKDSTARKRGGGTEDAEQDEEATEQERRAMKEMKKYDDGEIHDAHRAWRTQKEKGQLVRTVLSEINKRSAADGWCCG
jgi:type IV secretory pathway VirB9-like protein